MRRAALRRRLGLVGIAVLAVVGAIPAAVIVPVGAPLAAPPAVAASSGFTMTADARYVVDPAKRRVHVGVDISATNHRSDTKTHRYFFDRAFLAVQPGTTAFKVSSHGAKPTVRVARRTSTYTLLQIDFGTQLGAGASRGFRLTFDIADPGGSPTRTTRIGTSLVSFGAWGFGSAGNPGGSVTVQFPAGFSVEVDGSALGKPTTDAAGTITYASGRLADPLRFFASFVADRPGAYSETTLQVPINGRSVAIKIRAWPDDPAWAKRVSGLLTRALPALAADIGLPWPIDRPLIVSEAISRNTNGFAGRYNPQSGQIEIAYYASTFAILHEAAHAWFDGSLLADRWATEGFASWYALRAASAIGEKGVTGDALTPALDKLRIPLNAWGAPGVSDKATEDAEFAAALKLATLVGERAGADGLRDVWRSIHEGRGAYQPIGTQASLETVAAVPDWRGLLDLLQDRTGADYTDLWTSWVVRPAEASLLAARSAARERYPAVAQRAGDWTLPRVVRDALRVWQFDQASELLDGASTALDDRDTVAAAATAAGLTTPTTMAIDFSGQRGFAATSAEAEAELATIAAYRRADAARPADPGPIVRVGLWNSDPAMVLTDAARDYAAGDLTNSVQAAAFAERIWTSADEIGRNRIVAVGAILAALVLAIWLVIRWRRDRGVRRRRRMLQAHRGQ